MLTKSTAALRIQRSLTQLEEAIEEAMGQATQLQADMIAARGVEGVEISTGQATLMRMHSTHGYLLKASSNTARIHNELLKINHEVKAMPDENGDCPDIISASAEPSSVNSA